MLDWPMEDVDIDIDNMSHSSEKDQGPSSLDVDIGNLNGVIILSKDGLIARYSSCNDNTAGPSDNAAGPSRPGVTLLANAPCQPSIFSIFYYFEMLVTCASQSIQETYDKPANVAIGFTTKESWVHSKLLGTYPLSCGYYPRRGKIIYFDKEKRSRVEIRCSEPYEIESQDYVVGAGFHPCSGNIFFTFCGKVVALWRQSIFSRSQLFEGIFPAVSLLSYDAQVELYFGPSCKLFELEPIPTFLDRASCQSRDMILTNGNRSLSYIPKQKGIHESVCAIMADKPAPVRSAPFFYFEICIEKESSKAHRSDVLALGFACTDSFCNDKLPGYYKNSCGLILNQGKGKIVCHGMHIQKTFSQDYAQIAARRTHSSPARVHDHIGAGIHYGTEEIFFVKNGKFMGALSNKLRGTLRPVVALSGPATKKITYGGLEYKHWVNKPTRMMRSNKGVLHKYTIHHSGYVSAQNSPRVEGYRANDVAPLFSLRLEPYYFEVTVVNNAENGCIAIGFSHYKYFDTNGLPGCYPFSVGYHGDSSNLMRSGQKHGYHGDSGKKRCKFGPTFVAGDTVGAGIHHLTNTVFFVKNTQIVERIPLHELRSCALYPVIGLGSCLAAVRLNLGNQPFLFQVC